MKRIYKELLFIFIVVAIFFTVYWLRSVPTGMDSFYFMNYIYGITNTLPLTTSLATGVFSLIPANFNIIKIIMLVLTLCSAVIFSMTARLRFKKTGYLAGLFLLAFPFFSVIFARLEDDLFGLPFMLLAIYFATRYQVSDNKKKIWDKNIMLSIASLVIAVFLWRFTVYLIPIIFIMTKHFWYGLATASILPFYSTLYQSILPNLKVSENYPIYGLLILTLGFAYLKPSRIKENWVVVLVLSVLTVLNYKFIFLCVPFLILNIIKYIENDTNAIKKCFIIYFTLFFVVACAVNLIALPNSNLDDLLTVGYTESLDRNIEFNIQWGYGYYAIFKGYDTNQFGHAQDYKKSGIVLTYLNDKRIDDCDTIQKNRNAQLVYCE